MSRRQCCQRKRIFDPFHLQANIRKPKCSIASILNCNRCYFRDSFIFSILDIGACDIHQLVNVQLISKAEQIILFRFRFCLRIAIRTICLLYGENANPNENSSKKEPRQN